MKLRPLAVLTTMLAIGGLPPSAQTPSPQAPTGTALLTGRVVDGDGGAPVGGAVVELARRSADTATRVPRGQQAPRVLTDDDGRFFFRDLAAGSYALVVTKPGWIAGAFGRRKPGGGTPPVMGLLSAPGAPTTSIDLADAERRGGVSVSIWKFAVISGRVIDDRGDPIVGIDVRAMQIAYFAGHPTASVPGTTGGDTYAGRAITDDRGMFRFANLMPGNYFVAVPNTMTSQPAGFGYSARLGERAYLQTMTTIGAAPTLSDNDMQSPSGVDRFVLSSLTGLIGGRSSTGQWLAFPTTFFPSALSAATATIVRAETGRDRSGVELVMRAVPTFRISGTLTDPNGPASRHAVHLLPADAADTPLFDVATAVTDNDGTFTMFGVPPGQYIARVVRIPWPSQGQLGITGGTGSIPMVSQYSSGPSAAPPAGPPDPLMSVSVPVTVGDRDVANLTMTLRPGARLTGRIEFDGTAPRPTPAQIQQTRMLIEPVNAPPNDTSGLAEFAADGTLLSPSLWPGRYFVRGPNRLFGGLAGWTFKSATCEGRDISESPIELTEEMIANVVITFTDHPGKIEGSVRTQSGDAGVGALALLFPVDPKRWTDYGSTSRSIRSAGVSQSGAFTFTGTPPGSYYMVAVLEDQSADWQNPATMQKLAGLAEHVQIADGVPLKVALTIKQVPR